MGVMAEALVEGGARAEIEILGVWWRVKAVDTFGLVEAGGTVVFAAQAASRAAPENPSRAEVEQMVRFADALIIAGVIAGRPKPEAEWEPLALVASEKDQDVAKNRVWVGSLPMGARKALAGAVHGISTDGGAASERIARFLGGEQGDAGHDRAPVRDGS